MMTIELPKTAEENAALGLWVSQRIPNFKPNNFITMAFFEEGVGIAAVALYQNYRTSDIEIAFAAEPGTNWAQRDLINMVLRYPFTIGCHRVTAVARKDNKKVRKLLMQLGFKQEGKLRKADTDKQDLFIYGMLEGEARLERKEKLRKAA
jgi:RimJ/RimL family protein N-acetyltransferase